MYRRDKAAGEAARPGPEIEPVTLSEGDGPLIFLGPHNGYHVPKALHDENGRPLGLHKSAFDPTSPFKRHEACDWGVKELCSDLETAFSGQLASFINVNYSRLVCDLNRCPDTAIPLESSETGKPVPVNMGLSQMQKNARLDLIYKPYFEAFSRQVKRARESHGGAVVIDLHSFTPVWKEKKRGIHAGTLKVSDHPLSKVLEPLLQKRFAQNCMSFKPDEPYALRRLPPHRSYTAHKIETENVWYLGLEIRNDLLQSESQRHQIVSILEEVSYTLLSHGDFAAFGNKKQPKTASVMA